MYLLNQKKWRGTTEYNFTDVCPSHFQIRSSATEYRWLCLKVKLVIGLLIVLLLSLPNIPCVRHESHAAAVWSS